MEVGVRAKVALGGGSALILLLGLYQGISGKSIPGYLYVVVVIASVVLAQFWHGLVQFEKMRPRFEVRSSEVHFWGLKERGTSGAGYYFEVVNPSVSESLECVRAEVVACDPEPPSMYGILPFPLHIRHLTYCVTETFIHSGCSRRFDLATGPDHNVSQQQVIIIPGILGGDRGHTLGVPVPFDRYHLTIRISARHCPSVDVTYDLWVDEHDFLRCVEYRTSVAVAQ
jgi:hypothetical protein